MLDTLRTHRASAAAWFLGGALANFVMVLSLKQELDEFPGGPEMLARVLGPSIEAFRPLRWPAERLDTLGGYLTYHNLILMALFLAVYAIVQGTKAVRGSESLGSMELWLSAGVSRTRIIIVRSLGSALLLAAVASGIAGGTAVALSFAGEPNTSGAFLTLLATWCAAVICYGLGLLTSQFFTSTKVAAGASSTALVALYVLGNSAENLGVLGYLKYLSPFTYSNLSRALVPGIEPNWPSMAGMLLFASALIALSIWFYTSRDVAGVVWKRRSSNKRRVIHRPRVRPASLFGDGLYHGWIAILTWALSSAALMATMVSLEPVAMTAWEYFDVLLPAAPDEVSQREAQYLGLSTSMLIPLISGYVVAQSAKWNADFTSGRTGLILSAPVSWMGLLATRFSVLMLGVATVVVASIAALILVASSIGNHVDAQGLGRLTVVSLALGLALGALCALLIAWFRQRSAVLILTVYLSAAYLLTFIVPILDLPEWINRFSVFTAFGNPYLAWPSFTDSLVIFVLAGPGLVLSFIVTARSEKSP